MAQDVAAEDPAVPDGPQDAGRAGPGEVAEAAGEPAAGRAGPGEAAEPAPAGRRRGWGGWRARLGRAAHTRWAGAAAVLLVAVAGSAIGAALAPSVTTQVGPLTMDVRVRPSLHPGVKVLLPPAGVVTFDTHWAPVAVEARVSEVDLAGARRLIESPAELAALERSAPDDLRAATVEAGLLSVGCALLGAATLSLLVYRRRWRRTGQVAGALAAVLVVVGGTTAATFDPDRLAQPHFTGVLSQAPYIAGQARSLIQRLQGYRSGLADILQGVTTLYGMSGQLPAEPVGSTADVVTVLHVSDIHLNPLGFDLVDRLVSQFHVDLVVDTGDITTWGTEVESATLSRVGRVGVPYVFVRGNHDSVRTEAAIRQYPNAVVLDGGIAVVKGLVIAGIGDPKFTPDGPATDDSTATAVPPSRSTSPSASPGTSPSATPTSRGRGTPSVSGAPLGPPTGPPASTPGPPGPVGGTAATGSPQESGTGSPPASASADPEVRAGGRLADQIRAWNVAHPDQPVDLAAVHEPYAVPPLLGTVPLVLAGHLHKRSVDVDASGTRVMVEGSTGGAGVSADFKAVQQGDPVPLSATLLYVARSGPRAGQVLAYDEVTVGGFGLVSVSLQRTVVRDSEPAPRAGLARPSPSVTPGGAAGSETARPVLTPSGPPPTELPPSALVVPSTEPPGTGRASPGAVP